MLLSHKDPAAIITERYYVIGIQQPSSQNAITSWGSSSRHHRMLFHWEPAAVITERCYFIHRDPTAIITESSLTAAVLILVLV